MGLFGKLFRKKYNGKTPENSLVSSYKQDWDFYFSYVEDIIGSFYIDLGLLTIAPVSGKSHRLWVSVKMNAAREDGLSSEEEFDSLQSLGDRLSQAIVEKHDGLYAGRLTSNGHRDFYFYLGNPAFHDKTIEQAMSAFPSYTFSYGIDEDSEWDGYLNFLYPPERDYEIIQNRRVIDQLEANGDSLTKARPVFHWIYFKSDRDRNLFLSKIEGFNYEIVVKGKENSRAKYPYMLEISRKDKVDYDSAEKYLLQLWEFAKECNGEYDGWETSVETD